MMTNTGGEAEGAVQGTDEGGHSPVSAATGKTLWPNELAELVRGISHALSNRVGTVVAAAGMLTVGAPAPAAVVSVLRDEGERLEALLGLVRLLGGDGDESGGPEPLHLPDVVTPVVALHSHHPVSRDIPVTVTPDPTAPPVRARHAGLVRALLVMLSAVKTGGEATIAWRGTERGGVALEVAGSAGDERVADEAGRLLGQIGDVRATGTGYRVVLAGL